MRVPTARSQSNSYGLGERLGRQSELVGGGLLGLARSTGCLGAGAAGSTTPSTLAAVTQIRHPHSDGRAYYDRKITEGKTGMEAIRSLKRRISDAIYRQLQIDAQRAGASSATGP